MLQRDYFFVLWVYAELPTSAPGPFPQTVLACVLRALPELALP